MVSALEIGGAMALLLNLHKKINTDLVQFDYVSLHRGGQYDVLADSVKALGGKIYYFVDWTKNSVIQENIERNRIKGNYHFLMVILMETIIIIPKIM